MYTEYDCTLAGDRSVVNIGEQRCSQKDKMARKYELKSRAERQEATRQRIVEAAAELHEEVGPARTSISAIAERAGVERLTVYRHFATESDIFHACSAHFDELHPFPDFAAWASIHDPFERLERGLAELYDYFSDTERMTAAAIRDAPATPAMRDTFARYHEGFQGIATMLIAGFAAAGIPANRVSLPIRLATDFHTWHIMTREAKLDSRAAVAYQAGVVRWAAIGV